MVVVLLILLFDPAFDLCLGLWILEFGMNEGELWTT